MAIETAAMEDLLEQILKQTSAQTAMQAASFAKLAKAAGLDPKTVEATQTKLKKLGDAAEDSSVKVNHMATAGKIVGSVLGDLASGFSATIGNLAAFSAKALSGTASISDMFMAFKDLPIIGVVAGLFANLAKIQEENLASYRSLSKYGVNFGQALGELRETAVTLGLSLDQFTKIIASSSDTFAYMGKTANEGAKNFKNINLELTRTGGVGEQLRNLGYGFEDMNLLTASYVRVTGGLSKQQQQDYKGVAIAVAEYGKELDLIARITGRSREQQEKELEEQMKEANWRAFMSTQDDATRKKLELAVNEALANGKKGGADIIKATAQGLTAQSEAAGAIYSLGGELGGTLEKTARLAMDKTVKLTDFQEGSAKRLATGQYQAAEAYSAIMPTANALAQGNDKLAEQLGFGAEAFARRNLNEITSLEQAQTIAAKEKELAEKEANTRSGALKAALDLEASMLRLNAAFVRLGNVLIDQLLNPLTGVLEKNMPEIIKGIKDFAEVLKEWIPKLFNDEGRKEIIKKVVEGMVYILGAVAKQVGDNTSFGTKALMRGTAYGTGMAVPGAIAGGVPTGGIGAGPGAAVGFGIGFIGGVIDQSIRSLFGDSEGRASGSLGSTGKLFEDFGNGTNVTLHGEEGVFTPQQLSTMLEGGASIKLKASIDRLNSINEQILEHMKAVADNTERNLQATRDLNGNAFA